jgi:hypothetical protein
MDTITRCATAGPISSKWKRAEQLENAVNGNTVMMLRSSMPLPSGADQG